MTSRCQPCGRWNKRTTLTSTTATRNEGSGVADLRLSGHWKVGKKRSPAFTWRDVRLTFPVSSVRWRRPVCCWAGHRHCRATSGAQQPQARLWRAADLSLSPLRLTCGWLPRPTRRLKSAEKLPPCTARRDPSAFSQTTSGVKRIPGQTLAHGLLDITRTIGLETNFAWSYG